MRRYLRLMIAGSMVAAAPVAAATNGAMGPSSTGSVTITVTVAPRAYLISDDRLCVAAPASGYSLRLADAPTTLSTSAAQTPCAGRGESITLPPSVQTSGGTLLIVAE